MPTPHGFETWEERERRQREEERARKEALSPEEEAERRKKAGEARRLQTARRASAAVREILREWVEATYPPQVRALINFGDLVSSERQILDHPTDQSPSSLPSSHLGGYKRAHWEVVPAWGVVRRRGPETEETYLLLEVLADQQALEVRSEVVSEKHQELIARALHMETGLPVTVNPEPEQFELRWYRAATGAPGFGHPYVSGVKADPEPR